MLQELMLRIRQLETHVKVLQRASKEELHLHGNAEEKEVSSKMSSTSKPSSPEDHVVSLDERSNLLSGVGVKLMEEAGKN
ncbi:hypothetical protein MAR_029473 [Mya arenaria]|uniref:Uncharacterized protein n=1 Tax=Mya arenaria TaxID=6604 RepID=A0ABY7DHP8_MYAAR|nr:hypothetical protein MAR_029473 [Mya arenaria]